MVSARNCPAEPREGRLSLRTEPALNGDGVAGKKSEEDTGGKERNKRRVPSTLMPLVGDLPRKMQIFSTSLPPALLSPNPLPLTPHSLHFSLGRLAAALRSASSPVWV